MNGRIGAGGAHNSKDMVYRDYHSNEHEFFVILEFSQALLIKLKGQELKYIKDQLFRYSKELKRLVLYYFPYIIKKLEKEPHFKDYALSFFQDIESCSQTLNLVSVPGQLAPSAPLPGHITHYYAMIETWFNHYHALNLTVLNEQQDYKVLPKTQYMPTHINFINQTDNTQ